MSRRFAISRKTGYKWRTRFASLLQPGCTTNRTARRCGYQTPRRTEQAVLAWRGQHPT